MDPMGYHNDEKYRLRRDKPAPTGFAAFMGHILIPGLIGLFCVMFLYALIPFFLDTLGSNTKAERLLQQNMSKLNTEFGHLLALEWGETNIWGYMLFGFVAGAVIKYAFSDEKIT